MVPVEGEMGVWLREYLVRIGVYTAGAAGIGLFTGQWAAIEGFFRDYPAVGIVALFVDFSIFMIRCLEARENAEIAKRIKAAAKRVRSTRKKDGQ